MLQLQHQMQPPLFVLQNHAQNCIFQDQQRVKLNVLQEHYYNLELRNVYHVKQQKYLSKKANLMLVRKVKNLF